MLYFPNILRFYTKKMMPKVGEATATPTPPLETRLQPSDPTSLQSKPNHVRIRFISQAEGLSPSILSSFRCSPDQRLYINFLYWKPGFNNISAWEDHINFNISFYALRTRNFKYFIWTWVEVRQVVCNFPVCHISIWMERNKLLHFTLSRIDPW